MTSWIESHKPAAATHLHLLLAGSMWTGVGAALAVVGCRWLWLSPSPAAPWLAVTALVVGVAKSRVVLDRAARRIVDRIRERGDGRCVGGFLSLRSWGFVAVMVIAGRLLRGSHIARSALGAIYLAVGTALLLSSRIAWRAWRRRRIGVA